MAKDQPLGRGEPVDKPWTEVIRRIGKDDQFHYEVGPDADHLNIEIRYRETDVADGNFVVHTRLTVAPELVPGIIEALKKSLKELDPA